MSSSLSFLATIASPFHHDHSRYPRKATPASTHFSPLASGNASAYDNGGDKESILRLDRRNVLISTLGGLYGAATLGHENTAVASPVQPPDISKCHTAHAGQGAENVQCCPPYTDPSKIVDFKFPPPSMPLRTRKPAHLLDADDLAKYKEAYSRMKALDPSDPWSFEQQAKVHCQYCNGAYDQVGFNVPVQVHFSWIFLPWHRFYLHFHERILGKLIGDETFALPFWNWDSPDGMTMPSIFVNDKTSSLYNKRRDPDNLPPTVLDYQYSLKSSGNPYTDEELKMKNLYEMNKTFKESLPLPELFLGDPVKAGEEPSAGKTMGRLESIHNAMHQFVGTPEAPFRDMGNFYSAGYDPLFYSHHSNVDRMWHIYRQMRGNKVDLNDKDWLNASFLFYDDNRQLVRVKVEDSLNPQKLRYTYEDVELPWADRNIKKKVVKPPSGAKPRSRIALVQVSEFGPDPRPLDSTIRALVQRPKKSRTKSEKDDEVEVLFIDGIEIPHNGPVAFEVYVAAPYGGDFVGPDLGESAGSFLKLPHFHIRSSEDAQTKKFSLKLGISNLLEDIDAEGSEKVVVSLVPKVGEVAIGGIHIDLIKTDWTA
ncbi:polyphenol oxidase, chloroplastic-like [Magnolia sinica]|uniref:polyphenol oxidase, chloroplastic-like n=1 Tax=Magnolia sinica TaxID=86752 RepID=UPI002659A108|nr:polyphenol oxidase, chloroplastic-like [Magnolia sinica]